VHTVGSFDAKTHLSALLDRVAKGETIQITRRGVPVARLVPPGDSIRRDRRRLAQDIRELRKGNRLRGLKLRDLINEGRRCELMQAGADPPGPCCNLLEYGMGKATGRGVESASTVTPAISRASGK